MKARFYFFYRKKPIESIQREPSKLTRALNSFDLTTLGVGWTLGGIIYIVIGDTIVKHSGPSIVASFLIAGLASLLSGKIH
jgi:APA family basic amino acid/polyamine antiporter